MTTQFNKQASITEPILEALPSLAAGGLLARTAYKLDDIVEAVARRKHLQEALPELAKTLPKHEIKTLVNAANNKLISSAIPFGGTAAKTIDNIKANRYIAKEMKEVENLLKNPGENYKIGHVKESAGGIRFLQGINTALTKASPAILGRSLAGGISGGLAAGYASNGLDNSNTTLAPSIVGGMALGSVAGFNPALAGRAAKFLGRGTVAGGKAVGRGTVAGGKAVVEGAKTLGEGLGSGAERVWKGTKDIGSHALERTKNIGSHALERTKDIASGGWKATKALGEGGWQGAKTLGEGGWKATKALGEGAKDLGSHAYATVSNAGVHGAKTLGGDNMGALAGAAAGGYGAYMASDKSDMSAAQRAGLVAGGLLTGAIGGRAAFRGANMGLGTNYGKALVNQRGSRGLVRQAFGGFSAPKGSTSEYMKDVLPKIDKANMANAQQGISSKLKTDIAAGGMGLSDDSAHIATTNLLRGAEAQQGFLKNVKQRFDLASRLQPESAATRNMLMGSTAGAIGGGYAGYQASESDPYAAAAGAVTGGILGGFGGYKGYAGIAGRALFNRNDTLRAKYMQGLQTNPSLLEQNLGRISRGKGIQSRAETAYNEALQAKNTYNNSEVQPKIDAEATALTDLGKSRDALSAAQLSHESAKGGAIANTTWLKGLQTRIQKLESKASNTSTPLTPKEKTLLATLKNKLNSHQAAEKARGDLEAAQTSLASSEAAHATAKSEAAAAQTSLTRSQQYVNEAAALDNLNKSKAAIKDIQTNLALRQSGFNPQATRNVITVGDAPGTLKFVGSEGAGNLSISADAARNLGAKNPEIVSEQMNQSIGGLSNALQANVSKALTKGGPEAQQLVDTLTAHAKEVASVSNQIHDDVAAAITSQANFISKQSAMGLPGLEVPAERLANTPAFKNLVAEVSKGATLNSSRIQNALVEAGYTAPAAQLEQLSENLATALSPIAKNARAKLEAASSALQGNVSGTLTNISAAGHAAESKALQAAFTNARATMPASELNKLEAELQQAMELANKQGGENLDIIQGLMSTARKALQNRDSSAVSKAISEIRNFSNPLISKTPGFQSYTNKLTNQAGKVFNDVGDDFAAQASAYLPEGSGLLTTLEQVQNLSPAARNAIAKSSFKSLNIAETSEAIQAIGATAPQLGSYTRFRALDTSSLNEVGEILSGYKPELLKSISSPKNTGVAKQLIAELQQAGVTFSNNPTTAELTEALAQFSKYEREAKSTLDTAVKAFKAKFKAEAASGPLLTAPTGGIGQRASVQIDQAALDKANAAGRTLFPTEAPVVQEISQTAAPVAQQAQATAAPIAQQAARPVSGVTYGLGAVGVGGAGYGGYQYLNQAAAQAPVQQMTQAPLQNYYNRRSY